jgi:hypothetical protein
MSDIFENDMTYQIACAVVFDAVESHIQISTLENSGVSYLSPRNVGEDNREDGNNDS